MRTLSTHKLAVAALALASSLLLLGVLLIALAPDEEIAAPPRADADEWHPALSPPSDVPVEPDGLPPGNDFVGTTGGIVRGRVYEKESNTGLEKVEIQALLREGTEYKLAETALSGAAGNYEFSGLAEGSYRLELVTPVGFRPPTKPELRTVDVDAGTLLAGCDFALLPEVPLSGLVVGDRNLPVPGAEVHVKSSRFGNPLSRRRSVFTDAQGAFSFHNLIPSGTVMVQATTASACSEMVSIDLLPPGTDSLVLRLEEGASIEGRVVDPGGEPVAGIVLRFDDLSASTRWFVSRPPVTGPEGRFRMSPLSPGKYKIWLIIDGDSNHLLP